MALPLTHDHVYTPLHHHCRHVHQITPWSPPLGTGPIISVPARLELVAEFFLYIFSRFIRYHKHRSTEPRRFFFWSALYPSGHRRFSVFSGVLWCSSFAWTHPYLYRAGPLYGRDLNDTSRFWSHRARFLLCRTRMNHQPEERKHGDCDWCHNL